MLRPKIPDADFEKAENSGSISCCLWILLLQVALTVAVFVWIASTFKGCC